MGWQDREYASEYPQHGPRRSMYRGSGMGAWSLVTKIIIANVIVHALIFSGMFPGFGPHIQNFGVMHTNSVLHGQVWRLFTATYLHAGFAHIFINMLMLYFFGPMLERRWGPKQFFIAYTLGGVVGNVVLTLAGVFGFINPDVRGLGASGSVWTLMAAAAVYFPNAEVLIYFLFPVRLRTVVVVYGIWFVYNILQGGQNYGGDMSHIAGLLIGLWWAKTGGWAWAGGSASGYRGSPSRASSLKSFFGGSGSRPKREPTFRDRVKQRKTDAEMVDRLLAKVYDKGIHGLTPAEKRALSDATARLREEDVRASEVKKW